MEWVESLIHSNTAPWLIAFILGIVNAVSHCLLATNIVAISFISKDIQDKKKIFLNGIYYTLGRTVTLTLLAFVIIFLLQGSTSLESIEHFMGHYGDMIIGPLFLIIGFIMLFADKIHLPSISLNLNKNMEKRFKSGSFSSFLLGLVLALAFCPTSAFIFFGVLIPISTASSEGYLLPVIFSIATGLPVIISAWVLAFSFEKMNRFYDQAQTAGKWFRIILSIVFIVVGFYFIFFHHHDHMH